MKVIPFNAENVSTALARIHEQLGPEAFVLSMRPLPRQGLARFWAKSQAVEVLACVPEPGEPPLTATSSVAANPSSEGEPSALFSFSRRVAAPLHFEPCRPHVFVGPPGVGKTTLLCKWMSRCVLQQNLPARVWRLDGMEANTAEFLNVYAEMLGISVERFWPDSRSEAGLNPIITSANLLLIDLPGTNPDNPEALAYLKNTLACLPQARVHLVLNAAYDLGILLNQFRAFAPMQPEDVSFCHLDEERNQEKLQSFVTGTNCTLRFLSSGQKVPGEFLVAPEPPAVSSALVA